MSTDHLPENRTAEDLAILRDVMQYWLEWHDRTHRESNIEPSDEQYVMNDGFRNAPPAWPPRGTLKNWIALLDRAVSELKG